VAKKVSVGVSVGSELVAVPSRNTGAPTVVVVESSAGRVRAVTGAATAFTVTTKEGVVTAVLPVSSVATT
jgi:hypothetical protein